MLLTLAGPDDALAQAPYPNRAIRVIVPLPPASPLDAVARKLTETMSQDLGVSIIVDNKPGAAATMGTAEAARAAPDGYTLLLTVAEPLISAVAVIKIPYNPQRDFKLISKVAVSTAGAVLIASTKVKANNLGELIRETKASPTPLSYASFGPGSFPQQIVETLAKQAAVKFNEIPYKGTPPAINDLLAGQVDLGFSSAEQTASFITSGRLKAIAIQDKSAVLPRVQTFADAGFSSFVFHNKTWIGLAGPAGMPDSVVQRVLAAVKSATGDPNFRAYLASIGFDAVGNSPAQFLQEFQSEMAIVPGIIRGLGVVPQ